MENGTSSTNDLEIDYSDHAKGCTTDRPLSQEKRCKRKEFLSPKNTFSANKKRIVEDPRVMEAYKILKEVSERNEKRDDCIVYGEHIAHKLRGYDSCTRAIVQHHISNILFEADMGKYFNGNPYKQQLMQWDSDSGKNNQHGPSAPNISSVSPSLQSQVVYTPKNSLVSPSLSYSHLSATEENESHLCTVKPLFKVSFGSSGFEH
jgi:hypothetical protein